MPLAKYLKAAFLFHWNLLVFLGGLAFALLTGRPDVVVPLVLAAEAAYLALLGTHPKFQQSVDAQEAKAARQRGSAGAEQAMDRILRALPTASVRRFEDLRARCLELRQIAQQIHHPSPFDAVPTLEEMQLSGLDRLLWIYLRLLFTQHMLERFFQRTSEAQIHQDIRSVEERLRRTAEAPDGPQKQKVRKALEENLETCRERLANYQKARDTGELVQVEIEHLENRIRSLAELAISRQEPDFIAGQVDQVASSMVETERTMGELHFATGLDADDAVPEILRQGRVAETQAPRVREDEIRDEERQAPPAREDEIRFL